MLRAGTLFLAQEKCVEPMWVVPKIRVPFCTSKFEVPYHDL